VLRRKIIYNIHTMRRKIKTFLLLFLVFAIVGLIKIDVSAQSNGRSHYVSSTGHWISGAFLEKYENATNPEWIYGDPITDEFIDKESGRKIQYFERARFEYYPDEVDGLKVKQTNLGYYLYEQGSPLANIPDMPGCKEFPETGFKVCYAFLDFFESMAESSNSVTQYQVLKYKMVGSFNISKM
jgi:hypothetical protein